ncbi:hypothetical protein ED733_002449 [Metarhizium rileyi]|uniref:O-methyltransferase C-terminal domain-containing protein n=1 Tax=Metarhizium rileyi (strain RCEF 4871) TaxID=1649241 RepID=A0A5C6GCN1_METRR|nr:hypothetical protein ED733_002449 [Metarhizium rileyi]
MDSELQALNAALQKALDAFEGPLKQDRHESLKSTDSLPDKTIRSLASQTVDLADRVVKLLQPPTLQLAESFLDIIASRSLTVEEIAAQSKLQPIRLKQIMRVLHNNGIFDYEDSFGSYRNNSSSTLLMKDHWTQWYRWVDLYGNEFYEAARGIPDAIKEGEARCAAQITYQTEMPIFKYFAENGLQDKFHKTLGAGAVSQAPGLLADYPWAELSDAVVLDIGGGGGDFIVSLLRQFPCLRGALFELDSVVELLRPKFTSPDGQYADVAERMVHLHVGDFREALPSYEVYTMKWCLHNWLDHDVVKILRAVRQAITMTPRARMIIVESVLQEGRSSKVWRFGDMTMMSVSNGLERTESDWRGLINQTGWRVESISTLRNVWAAAIDIRPV